MSGIHTSLAGTFSAILIRDLARTAGRSGDVTGFGVSGRACMNSTHRAVSW